ncbi:MAG: DUF4358 domain-containing protein [Porcipelethomonas sp.]
MKKIKSAIAGLIMSAAVMVSATACGGSKEATKPLSDITKAVADSGIEFPEMIEVSEENFQFKYGVTADDYAEYSVMWAGSGGDADEICIVKANEDKVDTIKEAVEKRLDSQKDVFKDYVPEQYDKLCDTEVKTEGNYVYWLCTNDNSKAEDTLLSYFE